MRFWWKLLAVGAVGIGLKKIFDNRLDSNTRSGFPCKFDGEISQYMFDNIVKKATKTIKRISCVSTAGASVYATVQSQSGLSEWSFTLDFNDYGHLTGTYWITSDNSDSDIPKILGHKISSAIVNFSSDADDYVESGLDIHLLENNGTVCPRCGEQQTVLGAQFCGFCGFQFPL